MGLCCNCSDDVRVTPQGSIVSARKIQIIIVVSSDGAIYFV